MLIHSCFQNSLAKARREVKFISYKLTQKNYRLYLKMKKLDSHRVLCDRYATVKSSLYDYFMISTLNKLEDTQF